MIDEIIANPAISQGELARRFGRTQPWISQVINCDAFRERLAQRKSEVVDPVLLASLEERIRGAVDMSLQVIMKHMELGVQTGMGVNAAIRVLEHGSRALGYGAKSNQPAVVVQNYVALVPPKSLSAEAWVENHSPAPPLKTIEALIENQ